MAQQPKVLLRQLLRITRQWPFDPLKTDRNMKFHMAERIKGEFRQNMSESDPKKIAELMKVGRAELAALNGLLQGRIASEVP